MSVLLSHLADVNAADNRGRVPLMEAIVGGHDACVRVLLRSRADPGRINADGNSALTIAAALGAHEYVDLILDLHPNLIDVPGLHDRHLLHVAAENGHRETLSVLIAYEANPVSLDDHNNNPLHLACERGHTECADILCVHALQSGAVIVCRVYSQSYFPSSILR